MPISTLHLAGFWLTAIHHAGIALRAIADLSRTSPGQPSMVLAASLTLVLLLYEKAHADRRMGHAGARRFMALSDTQPGAVGGDSLAPAKAATGVLRGTVVSSEDGQPLEAVSVMVAGVRLATATDEQGRFAFPKFPVGTYEVRVSLTGYLAVTRPVSVLGSEAVVVEIRMDPAPIQLSTVEVIGTIRSVHNKVPGSGEVLGRDVITKTNPIGVGLLRKVSGVNVRDEEGLGLRPNVGVRGLIPTRSGKVLLLEDGVPFVQAPYGDAQTYYHPQIHRFQRVEVLKGSGQVMYGPQTIGAVINYLTPQPLAEPVRSARLMGGSRDFLVADAGYAKAWDRVGAVLAYSHLQSKLTRENTHANVHDASAKLTWTLNGASRLSLKAGYFRELTQATYAHLTQVEYEENPYQNPFVHDTLSSFRWSTHAIYEHSLGERGDLAANLYAYTFHRDWWRQGSNGGVNATPPPDTLGVRTVPHPGRVDGKNRNYWVVGLEPRVRLSRNLFGFAHEFDFGTRAHYEIQDRKQVLGDSPTARSGSLLENDYRQTLAFSAFVHDRVPLGKRWNVSGGLRIENVHHDRQERLSGTHGRDVLTSLIPGIGATYNPNTTLTLFTGVHRGYAPPQVQDQITNDGTSTDLGDEKSWNYELGLRTSAMRGVSLQATGFYMDFENQIIPKSSAGGSGTLFTTARRSIHGGFEVSGSARFDDLTGRRSGVVVEWAFTELPIARFTEHQLSSFDPNVDVEGHRLTYAPDRTLTASLQWSPTAKAGARLEAVYVGEQFSDDLSTRAGTPSGRQGLIPASTVWNADVHYDLAAWMTIMASAKNVTDRVYIQDRSRGILVGPPRLIHVGVRSTF